MHHLDDVLWADVGAELDEDGVEGEGSGPIEVDSALSFAGNRIGTVARQRNGDVLVVVVGRGGVGALLDGGR
jgi:hypothetical protein